LPGSILFDICLFKGAPLASGGLPMPYALLVALMEEYNETQKGVI
jgi:hypothetical protein